MSSAADPAIGVELVVLDQDSARAPRALWVGFAGDVNVLASDGSTGIIPNVQAGTLLPLRVRRVLSTNTTAAGLVWWY
jgi:hypothetical protein